ncbi:hypothetical protein ABW19_dt0206060 [Dactylella cylindrospora]|nr:hypothetical protein ABW19_dt0206060 [Dactylella cylindrospora]
MRLTGIGILKTQLFRGKGTRQNIPKRFIKFLSALLQVFKLLTFPISLGAINRSITPRSPLQPSRILLILPTIHNMNRYQLISPINLPNNRPIPQNLPGNPTNRRIQPLQERLRRIQKHHVIRRDNMNL